MPISSSLASGGGGGSKTDILMIFTLTSKGLNEAEKVRKELSNVSKETKNFGNTSKGASKDTSGFGQALKSLSTIMAGTVGVVIGLGAALQQVLAVGKGGAAYRQMAESFQTLNDTVAPNIDLLDKLSQASLNTVSKFDLMNAASVALAGLTGEFGDEMANALPRLLQIAKASEKLNPALGDSGFLFQSLTIGLKRLSPRLIDNTGLQIRLSEAYKKLADERGKATNELTSEEQQLALLNATLAAGDVLINQAGGNVASLTDVYSQLQANVDNSKNSFKAWFDQAIGRKVATSINLIIFGQKMLNEKFAQSVDVLNEATMSYKGYIDYAAGVALANDKITQSQYALIASYADRETRALLSTEDQATAKQLISELGLLSEVAFQTEDAITGVSNAYTSYIEKAIQAAVASRQMSEEQGNILLATQVDKLPIEDALASYMGIVDASPEQIDNFEKAIVDAMHQLGLMTEEERAAKIAREEQLKVMQGYVSQMDEIYARAGLLTEANSDITKSTLTLSETLKLATNDEDKVRIATELFGISLDENSISLYENQRAILVNKLATEELTEAKQEEIKAEIESIDVILGVADANQKLIDAQAKSAEEIRKTADEARNAKTAFQNMFEGLNLNLPSLAGGLLKDIEFLTAGGRDLQAQIELVGEAMKRELIPPDQAATVLEQLYVKSQALAIELGDTNRYDAIVGILENVNVQYDKVRASQQAGVLYEERINELKEEGKDITDELDQKTRDWAANQAVLNEKWSAAEGILNNIDDFDFSAVLGDAIDPETFKKAFSQLPDELQALFTEVFSQSQFEASVTPVVDANSLQSAYTDAFGNLRTDIPIPDDLMPFMEGGQVSTSAILDVTAEGEQLDLIQWFFDGASADQAATVAASFSPELSTEMEALLGDQPVNQTASVAVSDNIQSDLSELLNNSVINRTVNVTVNTTGGSNTTGVPTKKAGGGRVIKNQLYEVAEVRSELFIPDASGRVMQTIPSGYGKSQSQPSPIYVNINNPTISNDLDLEVLSFQIARKISERQRGRM